MTQYIMVYDDVTQRMKRTDSTIASVSGAEANYYYETSSGQTEFNIGESLSSKDVDVFVNGIFQRVGGSYDYTVDSVDDKVIFNSTVPANAVVTIRVAQIGVAIEDNNFDVGVGGQTQFVCSLGTITNSNRLEVYTNGYLQREGASYDYQRNVGSNAVDFNETVPENAWVIVRIYDAG